MQSGLRKVSSRIAEFLGDAYINLAQDYITAKSIIDNIDTGVWEAMLGYTITVMQTIAKPKSTAWYKSLWRNILASWSAAAALTAERYPLGFLHQKKEAYPTFPQFWHELGL